MADIEKSRITKIIKLHNEIHGLMIQGFEKAIELGKLLTEAKKELKHGQFTAWIKDNMPFDERTARRYMGVHEFRVRLKTDKVSDLATAYKLVENIRAFKKTATDYNLSDYRQKKLSYLMSPAVDREDVIEEIREAAYEQRDYEHDQRRVAHFPTKAQPEVLHLEKTLEEIKDKAKDLSRLITGFCIDLERLDIAKIECWEKVFTHWTLRDLLSSIGELYKFIDEVPEECEEPQERKQIESKVV